MKTAFITLLLLLTTLCFSQTDADASDSEATINWLTVEEAIEIQSGGETDKLFLFLIYAKGEPYGKLLNKTTLRDQKVIRLINEKYHCAMLDGEAKREISFEGTVFKYNPKGRRGYHELSLKLMGGRLAYPTLVFLDEKFEVIQTIEGYKPTAFLLPILTYFGEKRYKTQSWEDFQAEYREGNK